MKPTQTVCPNVLLLLVPLASSGKLYASIISVGYENFTGQNSAIVIRNRSVWPKPGALLKHFPVVTKEVSSGRWCR